MKRFIDELGALLGREGFSLERVRNFSYSPSMLVSQYVSASIPPISITAFTPGCSKRSCSKAMWTNASKTSKGRKNYRMDSYVEHPKEMKSMAGRYFKKH